MGRPRGRLLGPDWTPGPAGTAGLRLRGGVDWRSTWPPRARSSACGPRPYRARRAAPPSTRSAGCSGRNGWPRLLQLRKQPGTPKVLPPLHEGAEPYSLRPPQRARVAGHGARP